MNEQDCQIKDFDEEDVPSDDGMQKYRFIFKCLIYFTFLFFYETESAQFKKPTRPLAKVKNKVKT